jgi:hypothetical protein
MIENVSVLPVDQDVSLLLWMIPPEVSAGFPHFLSFFGLLSRVDPESGCLRNRFRALFLETIADPWLTLRSQFRKYTQFSSRLVNKSALKDDGYLIQVVVLSIFLKTFPQTSTLFRVVGQIETRRLRGGAARPDCSESPPSRVG